MAPRGRQAIRTDADLDAMRVHWAIIASAHIILARPDKLDRRAPQTLRNHRRFALHMRIDYGPPAKTAAGKFSMKGNLVRFQSKDLGDSHLVHRLKLRRDPGLRAIAVKADGGIQRFHRSVRQIGKLKLGHNPSGSRYAIHRLVIAPRHSHVAWGASQLFVLDPQLRTVRVFDSG